jgi:hypothetical protein
MAASSEGARAYLMARDMEIDAITIHALQFNGHELAKDLQVSFWSDLLSDSIYISIYVPSSASCRQ